MAELLAPAGSFEALVAAISNGADAIYLGMNRFGARAYASNFDNEELKKAIAYAHLRNVKIYITMNTIVFDSELLDAFKQIDFIYSEGVDGVIVQDLALFEYIVKNYPLMEAHCSTQMGLDDLEGALLLKELGAKRVVLSREVPYDKLCTIKKKLNLPIEIFVHGALCVSYSGNCLMSGLIGYRSGNRGRCVGSCRKPYELVNETTGEVLSNSYILSMKDLNTIDHINELKAFDSLKIEGRMKEPVYVANVIRCYRNALDGKVDNKFDLTKTFNRTFTKGYMFGEDKKNITNILKPNNFGYKIGYVKKKIKGGYILALSEDLCQNDSIRIDTFGVDTVLTLNRLYDLNDNLVSKASKTCIIKIKEQLNVNDIVYKVKDTNYYEMINQTYPNEFRRLPLDLYVYGNVGEKLSVTLTYEDTSVSFESDFIIDKAINKPTDKDAFVKQFQKLNDTVYYLNNVEFYLDNAFIPVSQINSLRRMGIELLNNERLKKRDALVRKENNQKPIAFDESSPSLSVYCNTLEQYNAAKELGIEVIYYKDNVVRRNQNVYKERQGDLLVGGYGGLYKYRNTNNFSTDFSFNVVNSKAVYLLHSLGAKRICLSHEINLEQINNLTSDYYKDNGGYPNLEMIVYGRQDMMFTNYCPLKVMNQCGQCKKNEYSIQDEYGHFPIISHEDCTTTILNGKVLNLIDDLENIKHINTFRIQLTKESYEESITVINMFKDKLKDMHKTNLFNKDTDTRGHFNKEIM